MCRTRCVLALVALYVGLAHSWDIAVGVGDQLIFYTDATKTNTVDLISQNLAALAYDEVHNMMLYVDKQSGYDAICGYAISSKENKCFIKRHGSNIRGIAFDPVTETLFFTDANDNSINWISLKPTSINNGIANILLKMDDFTPIDITVDSCGGYIYWTYTNNERMNFLNVKRARINGSEREEVHPENNVFNKFSLTIDTLTRKMYYMEALREPNEHQIITTHYWLRSDLNGQNLETIFYLINNTYPEEEFTVSNDYLYWVHSNASYKTICQIPKNAKRHTHPTELLGIIQFSAEKPIAIAANYKTKDQIKGLKDCEDLSSMIPTSTVTTDSLNTEHTTEPISETTVSCAPDYIVNECDVPVCHNYCLHGTCNSIFGILASCRCEAGYTGERCEVNECHGYCLNGGDCSLNGEDEPVCQCGGNHEGSRCEATKAVSLIAPNNTPHNLSLTDFLLKVSVTVEV